MASTIQIKRHTNGTDPYKDKTLASGELFWDKSSNQVYVGDGSNTIIQLDTAKKYFTDATTTFNRVYTTLAEVNSNYSIDTFDGSGENKYTMINLIDSMVNKSILVTQVAYLDTSTSPSQIHKATNLLPANLENTFIYGVLEILKYSQARCICRYTAMTGTDTNGPCRSWFGESHVTGSSSPYTTIWSGWKEVVSAEEDQTITGAKTFFAPNTHIATTYQSSTIAREGTDNTEADYLFTDFIDKGGKRLGVIGAIKTGTGGGNCSGAYLQADRTVTINDTPTKESRSVRLLLDPNASTDDKTCFVPNPSSKIDLGSNSNEWKNLYLSGEIHSPAFEDDGTTIQLATTATNLTNKPTISTLANSGQIAITAGGKTSDAHTISYSNFARWIGSYTDTLPEALVTSTDSSGKITYNIPNASTGLSGIGEFKPSIGSIIVFQIKTAAATNYYGPTFLQIAGSNSQEIYLWDAPAQGSNKLKADNYIAYYDGTYWQAAAASIGLPKAAYAASSHAWSHNILVKITDYDSSGDNYTSPGVSLSGITDVTLKLPQNIKATSFTATSDIRLKENIRDWTPQKSILDLPVKEFNFIGAKEKHVGCIAQDLQEICTEIVHEDENGYLSIEESKIVYLLLDEVRKLRKELDELKK